MIHTQPAVASETRWTLMVPCLAFFSLWQLLHILTGHIGTTAFAVQHAVPEDVAPDMSYRQAVGVRLNKTLKLLGSAANFLHMLIALFVSDAIMPMLYTILRHDGMCHQHLRNYVSAMLEPKDSQISEPIALIMARGDRAKACLACCSDLLAPRDATGIVPEHLQAWRLLIVTAPDFEKVVLDTWRSLFPCMAQFWYRFYEIWQCEFPWRLFTVLLPETTRRQMREVMDALLHCPLCCLDVGFSRQLRALAERSAASREARIEFLLSPNMVTILWSWARTLTASIYDLECFNAVLRRFSHGGRPEDFATTSAHGVLREMCLLFEQLYQRPPEDALKKAMTEAQRIMQQAPTTQQKKRGLKKGQKNAWQIWVSERSLIEKQASAGFSSDVFIRDRGWKRKLSKEWEGLTWQEQYKYYQKAADARGRALAGGSVSAGGCAPAKAGSSVSAGGCAPTVTGGSAPGHQVGHADALAVKAELGTLAIWVPETLSGDSASFLSCDEYNAGLRLRAQELGFGDRCTLLEIEQAWDEKYNLLQASDQTFNQTYPHLCRAKGDCARHGSVVLRVGRNIEKIYAKALRASQVEDGICVFRLRIRERVLSSFMVAHALLKPIRIICLPLSRSRARTGAYYELLRGVDGSPAFSLLYTMVSGCEIDWSALNRRTPIVLEQVDYQVADWDCLLIDDRDALRTWSFEVQPGRRSKPSPAAQALRRQENLIGRRQRASQGGLPPVADLPNEGSSSCSSEECSSEESASSSSSSAPAAQPMVVPDMGDRRARHHGVGFRTTDQDFVRACLGDAVYNDVVSLGYVFHFERRYGDHGRYVFRQYMEWPRKSSMGPLLCTGVLLSGYGDAAALVAMYNGFVRARIEAGKLLRDADSARVAAGEPPDFGASDDTDFG